MADAGPIPLLVAKNLSLATGLDPANYLDPSTGEQCSLVSGMFAYVVQMLLAFSALCVLFIKRHVERPQRPLLVWFFDVSKQALASAFGHVANILIAVAVAATAGGLSTPVDECAFYLFNLLLDSVVGVAVLLCGIRALTSLALRRGWSSLTRSGDYGSEDNPSYEIWTKQTSAFLLLVLLSKLVCTVVILVLEKPAAKLGQLLFAPVRSASPKLELLIVMVFVPGLCNALVFWVVDHLIMADKSGGGDDGGGGAGYHNYAAISTLDDQERGVEGELCGAATDALEKGDHGLSRRTTRGSDGEGGFLL